MDKHQSEKMSAVCDGEAVYDDVMSKAVNVSADLQTQWRQHHLIRDVLRGHPVSRDAIDLNQRVASALEAEPTILAPRKRITKQQVMKQAGGFAIAATIAVTAVLTVQQSGLAPQDGNITVANAPTARVQAVTENIQTVASKSEMPRVSNAVEKKLNSYIVNHNEYSATSNMQGMLPYVRIVGYVPTRQVANEK